MNKFLCSGAIWDYAEGANAQQTFGMSGNGSTVFIGANQDSSTTATPSVYYFVIGA